MRPASDAYGKSIPYICKVLDKHELDNLCRENGMKIDAIDHWRFWGGQYWSEGHQFERGERSASASPHDLACISLVRDITPS